LSISIRMKTGINETISLIPQPIAFLKTKNLQWELNNEALELGVREGARNRAISDEIEIKIISGEILLFVNARLPFAPLFE
jgi:thiamine pyrophosphokinase